MTPPDSQPTEAPASPPSFPLGGEDVQPQPTEQGATQANDEAPLGDISPDDVEVPVPLGDAPISADAPIAMPIPTDEVVDQPEIPFATDTPDEQATRLIFQVEADARVKLPSDAQACAKEQVKRLRAIAKACARRLEIL